MRNAPKISLILLVLVATALSVQNCARPKHHDDDAPTPTAAPSTPNPYNHSAALYRMTPEQASNAIQQALGLTLSAKSSDGAASDQFRTTFNIALGGVDFAPTRVRDPLAKVQTVLVARTLAYRAASQLIAAETNLVKAGQPAAIFTKCDIRTDRPALPGETTPAAQKSEEHWSSQLDDLYWRIYSRAPSPPERQQIHDSFLKIYRSENNSVFRAWVATIYVLLSTSEFWHV